MRINRQLMVMAGVMPTPLDRAIRRQQRALQKERRLIAKEAMLVEMISRREKGESGASPMPYQQMKETLEKMSKGEL